MEQIVELVVNQENVRVLILIVFGFACYVLLRSQTKDLGYSLNKRIDGVESSLSKRIDELKYNDFARLEKRMDGLEASLNKRMDGLEASILNLKTNDLAHLDKRIDGLNDTIKALTFTLEKNKFLEKEDKEYIDSRLDR